MDTVSAKALNDVKYWLESYCTWTQSFIILMNYVVRPQE